MLLKHRILTLVFVVMAAVSAHAQTSRLSGQVTDPQSSAIPNADVHILNQDSLVKRSVKTDGAGSYTIPFLPAGKYRVLVQAPGFSTSQSGDITLGVGQAIAFDVRLTVGSAVSTVEVEGGAASAAQVNTENAEVGGTVTGQEVRTLQLNGRNFTQLVALTPGVSNQTQQDEGKVGVLGSVAFSVNGGRTEYNSFNVDGSETLNTGINRDHSTLVVYPSVDAIEEIKVLTSNYGAQYPSTGNGTTIVTTKSGTDSYHGSLYEFLRNEAFNAKGYFDIGNKAPVYRRNDFGGTVGGPLSVPHLYDGKQRTHFFFSEEARLERTPTPYHIAVPSLAERGGDFSDVCPGPDCPKLPVNISNAAAALLQTNILPLPNSHTGCASSINSCYLSDIPLPTYFREELFRIDHNFTPRTIVTFRYIHDEWDTITPIPQFSQVTNSFPTIQNRFYGPGITIMARLTNALSGTLVNDLSLSYVNSHITLANVPGPFVSLSRPAALDTAPCATAPPQTGIYNIGPSSPTCGLGSIFQNGFGNKAPGISIAGTNAAYGGDGFSIDPGFTPWSHSNPVYTLSDNVSKTLGHHSLLFGAQWLIWQRNQVNGPTGAASGDVQGLLTFSNQRSLYTSGNAFADFLTMAGISSFQQDSGQAHYHQRYQIVEPYLQDDWKVTRRLTVNAGLRISLFGTYHEVDGHAYNWQKSAFNPSLARTVQVSTGNSSFDIGTIPGSGQLTDALTGAAVPIYLKNGQVNPIVTNGIVECGVSGVPESCMKGHLFNPAPRIGLAWDPLGSGKTSIRAGYGVFFEHGTADETNTGSLEANAPGVISMTQTNIVSLSCVGNQGANCSAAGPGAFPASVTAIPTKAIWPYIQQWSLSTERELAHNTLATIAYVGSKGTHLTAEREINQLLPAGSNNPFGPHEPLTSNVCSGGGNSYQLASGAVVGGNDPAFVNLQAACNGLGTGGIVDPNSQRQFAPGLSEVYSLENIATSAYNGFQATVREITGPFTLGAAYTYSHSFDDASDRSDTTFTNSFDLKSSRASSNFDQRHLLHVSYIYKLPLLPAYRHLAQNLNDDPDPDNKETIRLQPSDYGTSRFMQLLLNDWQVSGITLFETGIPFTVVNGGSTNGVAVPDNAGVYNGVGSGSYPDLVGNPKGDHPKIGGAGGRGTSSGPLLLNPGAFAAPRGLTFGDAGRNALNNPRRTNWDMALQRTFPLQHEGASLEFRAEAFNVFNHTQFRIYNPTLGNQSNNTANCYADSAAGYAAAGGGGTDCLTNSNFLHAVDAHRPRTIQFGLKLAF